MPSHSITQKTDIGHNITAEVGASVSIGDLVITSLSSSDLVRFSKQLLRSITCRDWNTAETYLTSLKSVGSLDDECSTLLALLEYKLNLCQGNATLINQELFLDLLRSPRSDLVIKDIVESIYIQHLSLSSEEDAIHRYRSSLHKGSYSEEVFYERLANQEELAQRLESGTSDLYEHELCSLVRCSIRTGEFQLAAEVAESLHNNFSNINSKIILSLAKAFNLHKEVDGLHYWLMSSPLMIELEGQINDCLELAKSSSDHRVVQVATILLAVSWFQRTDLIEICTANIGEAEKVIPLAGKFLTAQSDGINSCVSAKEILCKDELTISEDEYVIVSSEFFNGTVTDREVRRWLEKGGNVSALDSQAKTLMFIILNSIACAPEDIKQKLKLSGLLDGYLKSSLGYIHEYSIQAIYHLCTQLMRVELPLYVVQLLEPLLPINPWASPVLNVYAEALLGSDQLEKLDALIERMEGVEESFRLQAVKIERVLQANNFRAAIELTERALTKYSESCYYWSVLLRNLDLANSTTSEIEMAVSKIPKKILANFSEDGLRLLHFIAKGDLNLAESFILEWFIDDPVSMAIHVTNFHFNHIHHDQIADDRSYSSERCSLAVVYSLGKRQYTKLLVDNCGSSEYLLDSNCTLAEMFVDADIGEEVKLGINRYKIVEKLQPIVAAFRISLDIRQDINTGNDCFHKFSVESGNVEEMLEQIESISSGERLTEAEIDGKTIPLLMRLAHTHRKDLVRGALTYLCDKDSNRNFSLFSDGEAIEHSVVLDVLSLVYLSLSGFCYGLIKTGLKMYVTKETMEIVSEWIRQTGRADFLSIGKVGDSFIRTTAEDVAKDKTLKNLDILLNNCELIIPASIDMPETLSKFRDMVDVSHYSSLKASLSHSIPFLCLDSMVCTFYRGLEVKLANAYQFMVDINLATSSDYSRHVECHVQCGLVVPLMHQDVIDLCHHKESGQYWAAEVLKLYPNSYPSPGVALQVLSECCLKSICSAYLGAKGEFHLLEWRYTERVVNACCSSAIVCLEGKSAEQRFALFISVVLDALRPMNAISRCTLLFFRLFARGHFLDSNQISIELDVLYAANQASGREL